MSSGATTTATIQTQPAQQGPGSAPRHRRRRGGGNADVTANDTNETTATGSAPHNHTQHPRPPRAPRNPALAFRPATVPAPPSPRTGSPAPPRAAPNGHTHTQDARIGGGRASGRGGRERGQGRHQHTVVQQRQFGGALTSDNDASTTLQADAPEFKPGQAHNHAGPRQRQKQQQPRQRRMSKSTAPDIASRIHEDIDNGQYECAICTSEVTRRSKMWSCHMCWTVFHLECVKKWANNSEVAAAAQNGDTPAPRNWRCPGCNLPQDTKPSQYTCWCGKEHEPRPIPGINPHSCGQSCGFVRPCGHPCELGCHAGPHPPCSYSQQELCFCGKQATTRKCTGTNSDAGWSCGQPCGEVLGCGEHIHDAPCHPGLCGACEVPIEANCYCGKESKSILCCDKDDDKTSYRMSESGNEMEEFTGCYKSNHNCEALFDCGKHACEQPCHTKEPQVQHCPRSPDVVSQCACGKTPLSELGVERTSCEDVIPNCKKTCDKPLPCGHHCKAVCHTGDCGSCLERIDITCRCGRMTTQSMCHQGNTEPPQCFRICRTQLNCGRHACEERCCAGEHKAIERLSKKKKHRPITSAPRPIDDGFEAEHICMRVCGRPLSCGNHFCENLDHKGPCHSCREAIFDEISCHCGRTILQPPLPCGTQPPPCRYECDRPKACGHPQVPHNCHGDEDKCPRCPFLVEKNCLCGKKTLKNQQCGFTDVRCGEPCGRKLKCGSHFCRKTCHGPGDCEDASGACTQLCGKPKKSCEHPDEARCHAPYPCKEDQPCTYKIIITCDCQTHKQELRCSASKSSEGNTKKTLKCDEECFRLERNRKLALALNIDPAARLDDHVPYSQETLNLFAEHPKWCTEQEREFRVFAIDDTEKRLRFKPMPAHQRAFLHALAEDFGFDSESMDPEPHRHVAVFKTPRFVAAPNKTLRDCIRIRKGQLATQAAEDAEKKKEKARSSVATSNDPYNGFLLTNPRFALMLDDLEISVAAVQQHLASSPSSSQEGRPHVKLAFTVQFLPDGNAAIYAKPSMAQPERVIEAALKDMRFPLARAFNAMTPPFGTLQLCRFDGSLNILRRELDSSNEGGWSQVAAKAAATRRQPEQKTQATESGFMVLGNLAARKKREEDEVRKRETERLAEKERKRLARIRKQEESVLESWEEAEEKEEERERQGSGSSAGAAVSSAVASDGQTDGSGDGEDMQPANEDLQPVVSHGTTFVDAVEELPDTLSAESVPAVAEDHTVATKDIIADEPSTPATSVVVDDKTHAAISPETASEAVAGGAAAHALTGDVSTEQQAAAEEDATAAAQTQTI